MRRMAWGRVESGFVVLAAVVLAVALIAFLRTPAPLRWRLTTAAAERELQRRRARVQQGELVEIPAQPRRAWPRIVLWCLPLCPAIAFVLAMKTGVGLACTRIGGWNGMVLAIYFALWGMPLVVLAYTLVLAHMGWRGWVQRCFPPPDIVVPLRSWGDRTWRGRARAGLAMAMPLLGMVVVVLSWRAHEALLAGRDVATLAAQLEATSKCAAAR